MKLTDCVAGWITARSLNLAPSTVSGYKTLFRLYVAGTSAGMKEISDLDGSDMLEILRPLIDRGCTRQAQLLQVMVSASLKSAVRRREICWNPMDEIDRVRHRARSTPWLSVDQARQLLTSSADAGDPYYIAWLLMLCCGLRRGEMLGLRWSDIDEARGVLHIQRQRIEIDGSVLVTRPKSLCSVRDIPLSDSLLTVLRLHMAPPDDILKGTTAKELAGALDRALLRAGLPRITLHGLRHTMAAIAAEDGVAIRILQSLMGHAHYQTTADVYAHVNQRPRIEAARMISHTLLGTRLEIV